jgi:hypothetical protein
MIATGEEQPIKAASLVRRSGSEMLFFVSRIIKKQVLYWFFENLNKRFYSCESTSCIIIA